ncbi:MULTISPECIES: ester cyclase [unclassified Frankia]|uniref:ester cyclase n=1 Tax=unclassified Frankia TaxID=2632575 RepID=UPI002024C8FB
MIRATLRMLVRPDREQDFVDAWEKIASVVRRTPGNLRQSLLRTGPREFVITSDWDSPEAFQKFERSPEQDILTAPLRELRESARMEISEIVLHVEKEDPEISSERAESAVDRRVEANRRTILEHFRSLERGDVDAAVSAFAPDMVNHRLQPGSPPGRDGLAQTLAVVLRAFPTATWTVESIVADTENVVAKLAVEGEAQDVIMGVRAAGQRVTWRHIHWFRISDGTVVEHDAIRDDRGLLRQLGVGTGGTHSGGLGVSLPGGTRTLQPDTGDRDPAFTA